MFDLIRTIGLVASAPTTFRIIITVHVSSNLMHPLSTPLVLPRVSLVIRSLPMAAIRNVVELEKSGQRPLLLKHLLQMCQDLPPILLLILHKVAVLLPRQHPGAVGAAGDLEGAVAEDAGGFGWRLFTLESCFESI